MVIPIVVSALGILLKRLLKGLEDLEIRGQVQAIYGYKIIKTSEITEKSPGDLNRLAVS